MHLHIAGKRMNPLTTIEIVKAQRKDQELKVYYKKIKNAKTDNVFS